MKSILEQLQRSVFEQLRHRQELQGIEVLNYRRSDLESVLQVILGGKIGMCVIVMPPLPVSFLNNLPTACDARAELHIRILEDLYGNRSGKNALAVAEFIHSLLAGNLLRGSEIPYILGVKKNNPWRIRENFPESSKMEIELTFETDVHFLPFSHSNPFISNKS